MARLTDDPNDPALTHGPDDAPVPQSEVYLVLSEEERAKGFTRPLRMAYRHVGIAGPRYELRDLTPAERKRKGPAYVAFEPYPMDEAPKLGKSWTRAELDAIGQGCQAETRMSLPLCETYARNPGFYGSTYCTTCHRHLPVEEFVWVEDGERVGS